MLWASALSRFVEEGGVAREVSSRGLWVLCSPGPATQERLARVSGTGSLLPIGPPLAWRFGLDLCVLSMGFVQNASRGGGR